MSAVGTGRSMLNGGWRRWTSGPRGWALGAAVLAGLVFGAVWWQIGVWRTEPRELALRNDVQLRLSSRGQALASAVARRLTLLDGFHAFVELQPDPEQLNRTFPEFAGRLRQAVAGVRNLGVARGSTYVLVSPVEGNEKILGYDPLLDSRPEVREDASRALEGTAAVVSGPLELVQGGVGLIGRRAIHHDGRVWGFVAVVADLDPIIVEAGLDQPPADLAVAVRVKGKPPFVGLPDTFGPDAIVRDVNLPFGRWEIAGRPIGVALTRPAEARRLWAATGVVLSLIPMSLVFALTWRQRVRAVSHQETERLVSERTAALARTTVIVENSPVVLVQWRPGDGWPVEFVSDNITQFGYSADEFHSGRLRWADILTPEDRVRMEQETARDRAAGRQQLRQEYRIVTADGRVRWMEDRTSIVDLGDGRPRHQGIIIDITERKQREEAQREAEHRLRGILDRVQLVAVMVDAQGLVTFCNSYLLSLTGWTRQEVVGHDWFDLLVPEASRPGGRLRYQEALAQGGFDVSFELPIVTRDGRVRQIAWDSAVIRDTAGAIIGAASFGRDMTDQRELENQYRQSQKMEAIGQLAGGIAHDFNNLLQVMAGYASLLLEDLPPGAPLYDEISEIKQASDRATSLVRQLLAFSRRQAIERRPIQPNDTVSNILKILLRVIGEHIELVFTPGDRLPAALADAGQVEQVLLNLCVNARDAMPSGGRITIATSAVTVGDAFCAEHSWARTGEFVVVEVSDTGPGIPADVLDHIFEPFFTTKEVGKGTGLGLATVYGIVKQHEGMIDVANRLEGGTVFRIFLPASPADLRPEEPSDAGALAARGHETILLAEDEELVRNLAMRVLEQGGYRVLVAKDGAEAIALVESRGAEIDLALLDVVMPKANGPQVRARIRELQPATAVLYCSGYSRQMLPGSSVPDDENIELLVKPYPPGLLLDRVRLALARRAEARRHRRASAAAADAE
jgi:PAS domain S-box-containing protein